MKFCKITIFFFLFIIRILCFGTKIDLVKIVSKTREDQVYGRFMVSRVSVCGSFETEKIFWYHYTQQVLYAAKEQGREPLWDTFHNTKFDATGDFLPNIINLIIHLGNFPAFSFLILFPRKNESRRMRVTITIRFIERLMILVIVRGGPFWNLTEFQIFRCTRDLENCCLKISI